MSTEAEWVPLVFDDVVRFTPGAVEALTPGIRLLSAHDTTTPLLIGNDPVMWDQLQRQALDEAKADLAAGRLERVQRAADTALQVQQLEKVSTAPARPGLQALR